jgi:hypothetical protein
MSDTYFCPRCYGKLTYVAAPGKLTECHHCNRRVEPQYTRPLDGPVEPKSEAEINQTGERVRQMKELLQHGREAEAAALYQATFQVGRWEATESVRRLLPVGRLLPGSEAEQTSKAWLWPVIVVVLMLLVLGALIWGYGL